MRVTDQHHIRIWCHVEPEITALMHQPCVGIGEVGITGAAIFFDYAARTNIKYACRRIRNQLVNRTHKQALRRG